MPNQFLVKPNDQGGYDVFVRDLVSHGEYSSRYHHMVAECGYKEQEAAQELYHMVAEFVKKNTTSQLPLDMCEKYVFDLSQPGDIIILNDIYFVVNRPVRA